MNVTTHPPDVTVRQDAATAKPTTFPLPSDPDANVRQARSLVIQRLGDLPEPRPEQISDSNKISKEELRFRKVGLRAIERLRWFLNIEIRPYATLMRPTPEEVLHEAKLKKLDSELTSAQSFLVTPTSPIATYQTWLAQWKTLICASECASAIEHALKEKLKRTFSRGGHAATLAAFFALLMTWILFLAWGQGSAAGILPGEERILLGAFMLLHQIRIFAGLLFLDLDPSFRQALLLLGSNLARWEMIARLLLLSAHAMLAKAVDYPVLSFFLIVVQILSLLAFNLIYREILYRRDPQAKSNWVIVLGDIAFAGVCTSLLVTHFFDFHLAVWRVLGGVYLLVFLFEIGIVYREGLAIFWQEIKLYASQDFV